jgi:hypothetical protein
MVTRADLVAAIRKEDVPNPTRTSVAVGRLSSSTPLSAGAKRTATPSGRVAGTSTDHYARMMDDGGGVMHHDATRAWIDAGGKVPPWAIPTCVTPVVEEGETYQSATFAHTTFRPTRMVRHNAWEDPRDCNGAAPTVMGSW